MKYITLSYPSPHVALVLLDRPKKLNAINWDMLAELDAAVLSLASGPADIRCLVLASSSAHFTAGIDLATAGDIAGADTTDVARRALATTSHVRQLQRHAACLERCAVPVVAAISGYCLGLGIDLVASACIRLASADAAFAIKEVDIGLCADLGTIQRFQRIVGSDTWFRELCYTARRFGPEEAVRHGFLSSVYDTKEEMMEAAISMAENIASKSPVAVVATKQSILYSRDNTVNEGLAHVALMNGALLQTGDMEKAIMGSLPGGGDTPVVFSRL